jgi:membrane protein YqaA with SNARE-associated domain
VQSTINWLYTAAIALGGTGLFVVALLDSSFVSLPQINDLLVVLMVMRNKARMPYYAAMATLGSIAGCYVIYYLAEKGGEAFLRKRLAPARVDRALALYRKHGLLALMVPAILPPPAPFKLFVLAAGVANVRPVPFVLAIAVARGVRYFALGLLAINYGEAAVELMRTQGRVVALWVAGLLVLAAVSWWLWQRRRRRQDVDEAPSRASHVVPASASSDPAAHRKP